MEIGGLKGTFTLYLLGQVPADGHEGHLNMARDLLEAKDFAVLTVQAPMRETRGITDLAEALRAFRAACFRQFAKADGIALLDEWELDPGATLMRSIALYIGMPAYKVQTWLEDGSIVRPGVAKVVASEYERIPLDQKGLFVDLSDDTLGRRSVTDQERFGWFGPPEFAPFAADALTETLPALPPTQVMPRVDS